MEDYFIQLGEYQNVIRELRGAQASVILHGAIQYKVATKSAIAEDILFDINRQSTHLLMVHLDHEIHKMEALIFKLQNSHNHEKVNY